MKFRVTILCENSVGPISGSLGEHGFSALIEPAGREPFLFDTGRGATLLHNARLMNKDLTAVKMVAVSHGHFDHTGGLLPLLQTCGPKSIFGHPDILAQRYRVKDTGEAVAIGLPHDRSTLEAAGGRFDLSAEFRQLAPGVFLTGQVPRTTDFETGDQGFFFDTHGTVADKIPDDQSLILETDKGLVILLGCCHAGLINTLEHVALVTGRRDVYAVIGGTHLGFCAREQLDQTITALKPYGLSKLAASHCTGFAASARLSCEYPREFQIAMVGYTLEV